ncbi:hypothetical protein [Microbacterium sp.]|uniref:hypothetical protein n=1 Tax=Microbacterium sp. TaxID=51671 RepID=UPI0039E295E8
MTTTLTPPPLPPTPAAAAGGPAPTRASSRVIAVLAIAFGTVLILGAIFTGVFAALRGSPQTTSFTADAAGITELDIDVAAAELTVVYSGSEARLDVTGNTSDWRLTRDDDTLSVATERDWWGGFRWFDDGDSAVLTLPASLENTAIDGDFSLSAGVLRAHGRYGELDLDLSAGSMDVSGSARSVDADAAAGRLLFDLSGVDEADLRLSAGAMTATLSGVAPSDVSVDVSAGRLVLTLPDAVYDVTGDSTAGEFQNRLSLDPGSAHRVSVSLSAGFVRLQSAG